MPPKYDPEFLNWYLMYLVTGRRDHYELAKITPSRPYDYRVFFREILEECFPDLEIKDPLASQVELATALARHLATRAVTQPPTE